MVTDSHGFRVSVKETVDSNGATTTFEAASVFTTTEYLLDQANPSYSQTIVETSKNSSGQRTKRIAYTFGSDEISQTVTTFNPTTQAVLTTEVHTFGHDGHGSVRVLIDAASKLAQAYTYAAYGELLAIHNGLGASLGNAASSALTSMLYNGESFDGRIGQLYLRARWYDGHRFTTIDPYAGDASNPFSFNKYGFVHADPIQGIYQTGMFFGLGGFMVGAFMNGGLRAETTKAYMELFGEVGSLADGEFGGAWRTIQLIGLMSGIGGVTVGAVLNSGGLPSIQRGLRAMLPFLASKVTKFLERSIVLSSREAFERLSSSGQAAVLLARELRKGDPTGPRNVAAIAYSVRDSAGSWVQQSPIARWSTSRPDKFHSESVVLQEIKNKHGDNFRVDSVFSERVPCTDPKHDCALMLANQESQQGSLIESINFGIDPGAGSISAIDRAWQDFASWIGVIN